MSRLSDAATTATGLALGAAIIGAPIGIWLARRWRNQPITGRAAETYSQSDAVTTSISNLKGAEQ